MRTPTAVSTDILIVGAGPVGLYGAYYAGFRGLTTTVVDVLPQAGGQVMALYPEKEIRDIAGLPSVKGRELIAGLLQQAAVFAPRYLLGRQAVTLSYDGGDPVVTLDDGAVIKAKAVLLTAGIGTPTPRPLAVGSEWVGSAASHFVISPSDHTDQHIVIVGGGDSALDWADALAGCARSVTLVHRRAAFRGHAATLQRVRDAGIRILTDTEVVSFHGDLDAGRLDKVGLRSTEGETLLVEADHVIAALGFISDLGPLREWELTLRGRSVEIDRGGRTNRPRVYAAGDLADFDGKVKLIAVGFGEVATAVNHIAVELDPDLTLFPGHSTDAP